MVCHDRSFVAFLLLVGAVLLLVRLEDRFLWQDEAETALLAQSVLEHGVPTARIGGNLVSQEGGQEFDETDHRWFWTPWLQHYATAASFAVFGPSTSSARFPFVLFGLGALYLTHALAFAISREAWVGRAAGLLLLGNVPFLLHARQCRYYAPAAFFALLLVWQYLRALEGRRGSYALLVVAAVGLFHSQYVLCAGIGFGLALHFVIFDRRRAVFLRFGAAALVAFGLTAPFLAGFVARGAGQALPGFARSLDALGQALFHLNRYAIPFVLPAGVLGVWLWEKRAGASETDDVGHELAAGTTSGGLALLLAGGMGTLTLIGVMPWFFFRYYVPLIPLAAVGQALLLAPWLGKRRMGAVAIVLLLAMTDVAGRVLPLPHAVDARSTLQFRTGGEESGRVVGRWAAWIPMAGYVYEIAHDHTGPVEALVGRIAHEVEAGQTMVATYGDLPVQFYLPGLRVLGGLSGEDPGAWRTADWLFVRAHTHRSGDARLKRFIAKAVDRADYELIHLGVPDVPYENRPDPTYHKFELPEVGAVPEARVWRRIADDQESTPRG